MAKNGTEFSKYAKAFYKNIEGEKSGKAEFVKMLLQMGLSKNGKKIIDELFPTETTSRGNTIIKKASDRLRKYFRGENDISDIADEVYAALDHENYGDYIKALRDYEDSLLIEFTKSLKLDTDITDINKVKYDIAAYYYSIIEKASTQKCLESNKTNDSKDVVFSYTITRSEKEVLIKLCESIKTTLRDLEHHTIKISEHKHEINNLTDSEEDKRWKQHLESEITSSVKRFNDTYLKLEKLCAGINELLEPKKGISTFFEALLLIANNISNDEYKLIANNIGNDEYKPVGTKQNKYRVFLHIISQFNDKIGKVLLVIDKL